MSEPTSNLPERRVIGRNRGRTMPASGELKAWRARKKWNPAGNSANPPGQTAIWVEGSPAQSKKLTGTF